MLHRLNFALISVWLLTLPVLGSQDAWPTKRWPHAEPKDAGLAAAVLEKWDAELKQNKYGHIDSVLIIRHGKVVFERNYPNDYDRIYGELAKQKSPLNALDPTGPYNYFNAWWHPFYRRGEPHSMQSVTKTITSVVIGIAHGQGKFPDLDTPVLKYFDESKVRNVDDRKRRMTIRHLLTMTAGFEWDEWIPFEDPRNCCTQMEASCDWIDYTINKPMAVQPGKVFAYNSGASMLLADIFRKATGHDIEEYAAKNLFGPLGITNYYWKRTPTGLVDTEGGLYLRPQDLAKVGYLFLKDGLWEGNRLLQSHWIKDSLQPHATIGRSNMKYGYKWWLLPYGDGNTKVAWAMRGFGDQMLLVLPDYDAIIVCTGWNIQPGKASLSHQAVLAQFLKALLN